MEITYYSETPEDYAKERSAAENLPELLVVLNKYKMVANDALEIVEQWTVQEFEQFRAASIMEAKGKFSGEENAKRFSDVLMPEFLFRLSIIATQSHVPWGTVYKRMRTHGLIVHRGGVAYIKPGNGEA